MTAPDSVTMCPRAEDVKAPNTHMAPQIVVGLPCAQIRKTCGSALRCFLLAPPECPLGADRTTVGSKGTSILRREPKCLEPNGPEPKWLRSLISGVYMKPNTISVYGLGLPRPFLYAFRSTGGVRQRERVCKASSFLHHEGKIPRPGQKTESPIGQRANGVDIGVCVAGKK